MYWTHTHDDEADDDDATRYTREYVDYLWEFNWKRSESNISYQLWVAQLATFNALLLIHISYFTCLRFTKKRKKNETYIIRKWIRMGLPFSSFLCCCCYMLLRLSTNASPLRIIILTCSFFFFFFCTTMEISFCICLLFVRPKRMWRFFVIIIMIVVVVVVFTLYISFYKSSTADVVARYFHYSTGFFSVWQRFYKKRNMAVALFVVCAVSIMIYNFMLAYV